MTFRLPRENPCAPNSASAASTTAARRIGSRRAQVTVGIGTSSRYMTTGHTTVSHFTVKVARRRIAEGGPLHVGAPIPRLLAGGVNDQDVDLGFAGDVGG